MPKIIVTGGAGRLGRLVIDDLLAQGNEVLAVDSVQADDLKCPFVRNDLGATTTVCELLQGADAVVHLAAVPGPTVAKPATIFQTNVLTTYNVVEAAAAAGLERVVFASSVFTLGWHEEADRYWPRYVPVDESHPLTPFEAYGLSKVVGEEICAAAFRAHGLRSVSLRIMNVIPPDKLPTLPWPRPTRGQGVRFVLWPYVDARDAARACRLALQAPIQGHEACFIAARDIRFDCPTQELLQELAPQVEIRGRLEGRDSVISCARAKSLLGYEPRWSWQDDRVREGE